MEEGKKAKKWAARVWTREALLLTSLAALGIMFGVTQTAVSFYRGKQTDLANMWFQRGDAALNAELLRRVLDGGHGPYRDVVLAKQGDYVVFHGVGHSWYAEEESVILGVRWPSVPGYAIAGADQAQPP